jgi:hypothetical protein
MGPDRAWNQDQLWFTRLNWTSSESSEGSHSYQIPIYGHESHGTQNQKSSCW